MLTRNLLSSPNVDQERLKRLVTAKDKSIRARNEQIKKIKNEKTKIAASLEKAESSLLEKEVSLLFVLSIKSNSALFSSFKMLF